MLMAAATHMAGSAHSSPSTSISPLRPAVLVPKHLQQHGHQVLYDLDLGTPSPTTPAATPSPPRHNYNHLCPTASRQRAGKPRRPRPSRKLPTTYVSADAATFRRMVHQVTGADDVLLPDPGPAAPGPGPELLCRQQAPAPSSRAGLTTTTETLLPTLDTSAFLMLLAATGEVSGGAAPAQPGVTCCHGSAAAADPRAALQVTAEACGGGGGVGGGRGFPSLQSWDEDDALF